MRDTHRSVIGRRRSGDRLVLLILIAAASGFATTPQAGPVRHVAPGAGPLPGAWVAQGHLPAGTHGAVPLDLIAGTGTAPETAGADRRVNDPEHDRWGPTCNTQSEVSIASAGPLVAAGWNDAGRCDLIAHHAVAGAGAGLSLSGYGWSDDGGLTWHDGTQIPPPEGWSLLGDPALTAGPDPGVFYYAMLAHVPGPDGGQRMIAVARSTTGGASYETPVVASVGRHPDACHDKPWITADTSDGPHGGTVYVAWTEVSPCGSLDPEVTVLLSRARPSEDGSLAFEPPVKLSTVVEDPGIPEPNRREEPGFGTQVAVGPDGEVYVAWPASNDNVQLVASYDGGVTFSGPRFIVSPRSIGEPELGCTLPASVPPNFVRVLNGDIRVRNWVSLAVDTSGTADPEDPSYNPYRGRIYVAVPHEVDFAHSDVALAYSPDRGLSWEGIRVGGGGVYRPTRLLNDDGSPSADQFHPQVAVAEDATVAVTWYDRRSDPDNLALDVYGTVSTDGGETFAPNVRLSDESFPPARTNPNTNLLGGCYMGEYNGLVSTGPGEFLTAWGDTRNGPRDLPDPDVYTDTVRVAAP